MFCHSCGTQINSELQFCPQCGASTAAPVPPTAASVWTPAAGIRAQTGRWISAGWNLVWADIGNWALVGLVFLLLSGVPFIQGPMVAGFHAYCIKKLTNRRAELADLFAGFNYFVPTLVASLIIGLMVGFGALLCIIPGIVLAAMYKFTYLFIVDKRMDFWPAMQASHAVVKSDYFGFTLFLITLALLNLAGFLCCIVGLLATTPITLAAITIAYSETVGFDPRTVEQI